MTGNAISQGRCLTDETLTDYLDGGFDPAIKAATEAHLVACDECRVRLASFLRLLKADIDQDEAVAIAAVQQEWMRSQNDRRLYGRRVGGSRRWQIASGTVAAALLIAVGTRVAMDYKGEPKSATEVIHLLLAQNRPFESRISGQPFRPFSRTRGPSDPGVSYSLLAGQMTRLGATTYEMGQFHLLQRDFVNATKYLELAAREVGAAAEVHNDLGVAYMESGDPMNLQKAAGEFRRALGAKPDFTAAAFNLAVLYERMGKTEEAESQWTQYLQLEPDVTWKDEAKSKLEAVKR